LLYSNISEGQKSIVLACWSQCAPQSDTCFRRPARIYTRLSNTQIMEVSARRSATLPGRPLCAGGVYGRSSPVSLCSLRGSPGAALDSDVYWPPQLCCVWPQDLEPLPTALRSPELSLSIQAPAEDPLVCSSTRQCWLQLWVLCTVVRRCCDCTASSAPTTNVPTRPPREDICSR